MNSNAVNVISDSITALFLAKGKPMPSGVIEVWIRVIEKLELAEGALNVPELLSAFDAYMLDGADTYSVTVGKVVELYRGDRETKAGRAYSLVINELRTASKKEFNSWVTGHADTSMLYAVNSIGYEILSKSDADGLRYLRKDFVSAYMRADSSKLQKQITEKMKLASGDKIKIEGGK